jgi:UDPglucose 6-dehydrogenase
MTLGIIGCGYVGLTAAVVLAESNFNCICVENNSQVLSELKHYRARFDEPKISEKLAELSETGRLEFTDNFSYALKKSDVIFVCVGTPFNVQTNQVDLTPLLQLASLIGENIDSDKLIVIKSTIPVGTTTQFKALITDQLERRKVEIGFDVLHNPEFLSQGQTYDDFKLPRRIVIGAEKPSSAETLIKIYRRFIDPSVPILIMSTASAELSKYAANAMLATKISFINEISRVCEKADANISDIKNVLGLDPRIGDQFLDAGLGYGGGCLPKDMSALIQFGEKKDEKLELLRAVKDVNLKQRQRFIQKILSKSKPDKTKIYTIWGISFKPKTDDIREAPALDIIDELLKAGCQVNCYDPVAKKNTVDYFNNDSRIHFFSDQYEALNKSHALIIPTEWKSFRQPDFQIMKNKMTAHQIFDGRNIYNDVDLKGFGFEYHSIGRPGIAL